MPQISSPYQKIAVAQDYDRNRFSGRFGGHLLSQEIETFMELIRDIDGPVLDVGAGTGKLSLPLLKAGRTVVSIDKHDPMLLVLREKAKREGIEGVFLQGDAESLPFRDGEFDCVLSSRVLMHLTDWRKALREWCRVSRRAVVFDFPVRFSFASVDAFLKRPGRWIRPGVIAYRTYGINEIQVALKASGFRIETLSRRYFLPMIFHRILNRPTVSIWMERLFDKWGLTSRFGSPAVIRAVRQ